MSRILHWAIPLGNTVDGVWTLLEYALGWNHETDLTVKYLQTLGEVR